MKLWKRQLGTILLVTGLLLYGCLDLIPNLLGGQSAVLPAYAQASERRAIASAVYDQIPDFPLENHYIHTETGEVDSGNTLVYRLIQYHDKVKSRPLTSRFDWKLTLADYLGANAWMDEELYPDRFLAANPFQQDIEIIRTLNRQQREELIQALLVAL